MALVKIKDYYDFLTDEDKNIRQYLFDANIRDFQGSVEVNKDIKDTLECKFELDTDFWWLNNGITILASKVTTTGDIITMDNLQIVNGLQTSHSIYNCFTNIIQENKEKLVFIKIIEIENQEDLAITKIIKATNFQTPIAIPSFRASDSIQKDIEDFLKSKGLYYDRRKNYYKNQGKNVNEIITMQTMAQCINALVLKNPGLSRRSPAGLTKKDDKYNEIFNSTDMNLYSNAILFMRKANSIIRDFYQDPAYKKRECLNLSFHISLRALQIFLNKIDFGTDDIIKINVDLLTIEIVKTALEEVITKAREQEVTKGETILNIAKSVDFSELVKTGNIVK